MPPGNPKMTDGRSTFVRPAARKNLTRIRRSIKYASNLMNESNKTPPCLRACFDVRTVSDLRRAESGSMMFDEMMGHGWTGGFGFKWIPTLFTPGIGLLPGWMAFAQKKLPAPDWRYKDGRTTS